MRIRLPRIFYGWWIVASGGALGSLNAGFYFYGIGAFFTPILNEFGWSRAELSGASSLARLQEGLAAPLAGAAVDRFGPRRVILVGTLAFGASFLALSKVPNNILLFYFLFAVMSAGNSFSTIMPAIISVNNWFVRRRGLAMGVLMAGFGIGGAIGLPFLGWLIDQEGWRNAMVFVGLAFWAVGIPVALVTRRRPEDHGLLPDGITKATPIGPDTGPIPNPVVSEEVNFTSRQALATSAFWLLSISFGIRQMISAAVALHEVPFLVNRDFSLPDATAVLGLMVLISIPGRLFWGWLGDRWDRRWVLVICHLLIGFGVILLATTPSATSDDRLDLVWRVAAFVVIYGIGYGGTIPVSLAMMAEYFGRLSYGKVQGMSSLVTMVGNIAGPVLAGYIFDVTQSYELALILCGVITIAGLPIFWMVRKPQVRQPAVIVGV